MSERLDSGLLPDLTGYRLRRAQLRAFADFDARLGHFGLTPGQVGVLVLIRRNAGLSQSDLARALRVERSTLGVTLARLESRGLLTRAPSATDRRRNVLALSEKCETLMAELEPALAAQDAELLGDLSPAEQETFRALLARLG